MGADDEHALVKSAGRSLASALVIGSALTLVLLVLDFGSVAPAGKVPRTRTVDPAEPPHNFLPPERPREVVPPVWVIPPDPHRGWSAPTRHPDVAPKLLKSVSPRYPEEARRARISGVVMIEVVVETDGTISHGHVLKPLPFGLTRAAVECLREWRYEPATVGGKPVSAFTVAAVPFRWPPKESE